MVRRVHCVRRAGCYGHARRVTATATVKEIFSHLLWGTDEHHKTPLLK
jgi:hypothetical protein